MSEFFAMGGYAVFVWSSFALTAVVLILNIVLPRAHLRRVQREARADWLEDAERAAARRREAAEYKPPNNGKKPNESTT